MPRTTVNIPARHEGALAKLVGLPLKKRQALLRAISEAQPKLSPQDFAADLGKTVPFEAGEAREIIELLASLYVALDRLGVPKKQFAKDVADAAKLKKLNLAPELGTWSEFEAFLAKLLSFDSSLGVTSKALYVLVQNEHSFCDARTVSDLRPVFKPALSTLPEAAVVVHHLGIEYHADGEIRSFFVALDSSDLVELHNVIKRALEKDVTLRKLAEKAGMRIVRPTLGEGA